MSEVRGGGDGAGRATPGLAVCLWFNGAAEEAAGFYCNLFPQSAIGKVHRAPMDYPGGKRGDAILVEFELLGRAMVALNGGEGAPHSTAMSLQVYTDTQEETDRYWDALLAEGGAPMACAWCRDRWGVHWQVVPRVLMEGLGHPEEDVRRRVNEAMMTMVKIDHRAIEEAIGPTAD